jgi:hypothetical protein
MNVAQLPAPLTKAQAQAILDLITAARSVVAWNDNPDGDSKQLAEVMYDLELALESIDQTRS